MVECNGQRLDHAYTARGDPIRRVILAGLAAKPVTLIEIARPFPVSLTAISNHLKLLERTGLVRRPAIEREHHSSLDPQRLGDTAVRLAHYRAIGGSD